MKLNDEMKKKIVDFLMDGKNEMIVMHDYDGEDKEVFTREEVENHVNDCNSFGELEVLIINDYELSMIDMSFGDVLDAIYRV